MAEDTRRCQYEVVRGKICPHPYFATAKRPGDREERDYCIFHAPLAAKTDRLGLFWFKFWRLFANAKKAAANAQTDEKKSEVVLDCEGFIFPDTGSRFAGRVFPFYVEFRWATFSDEANFRRATFEGRATFLLATYEGDANFEGANFEGAVAFDQATFAGEAAFGWATFSGEADFCLAKFFADIYFNGAEFSGAVDFRQATFLAGAHFGGPKFSAAVDFRWALLTQADLRGVDLRGFDFGGAKIGEFAQRIEGGVGDDCALSGNGRLVPIGSANFANVEYNAHTDYLWLNIYRACFAVKWLVKRAVKVFYKKAGLPQYLPYWFRRTNFLGVDTSAVDWSRNPALGRDIRYQQFLAQFYQKKPLWLYRPFYFLWWLTSRWGESIWRWLGWSVALVFLFAAIYTFGSERDGGPLIIERPIVTGEYAAGGDKLVFGNKVVAKPDFYTSLYFSVVTFTTLGFGDVTQNGPVGKLVIVVEVILGYVMLGGLIAIFANTFVRRE